jgi:hypothetical protein
MSQQTPVTRAQISTAAGCDFVKTETIPTYDGQQGSTLAQGR